MPNTQTPRVLIIAPHGSYRTSPFIQAARQQQCDVLIASQGKYSIVSEYAQGLQINLQEIDEAVRRILEEAEKHPFTGIIGTDDSSTEIATRVAAKLGLPHNPVKAVQLANRKDHARQQLARFKVNIPSFRILNLLEPLASQCEGLQFPCVLKPVGLSASRGVIRVDEIGELAEAVARVENILENEGALPDDVRHTLLLEEFIPGQEVAVEGMLYQGNLEILTVFDKPDPMNGPYFEETYYLTPSRFSEDVQQQIYQQLETACQAYGLVEGPIHAECRINENGVFLLEMAARTIGGLCGRLLTFGTGYSLEELVLAHARGERLALERQDEAAGVLMIPIPEAGILKRIEGLLTAQQVPLIEEVNIQIREGYELIPLPEGGSYLGFIFARGEHVEEVEQALRKAHACLKIVTAPLWKVQI
ncbi:MAG: ATP-grasp domain-containing protein [Gammaproteobacteria bacterium]|nr:ATP-grasp domain-containing protein [Gammaproteobacteria bacterium]